MFRKVAVIGIGTLGGFLCKHISDLDGVKELVIIDYDIVESKNTFRSIYNSSHIGEYKVNALAEILNDDVSITKINHKYIEGKILLPHCDLIIDCRDIVCNRNNEIDIRLYISGRVLIVDCRKQVKNACSYDGTYSVKLTKNEVNKAAFYAAQIIDSRNIYKMMSQNMVQRIDLDIVPVILNKSITRTLENKIDIIYDDENISRRLQCVEDNIKPILKLNKQHPIDVYVGEKQHQNIIQKIFNKNPGIEKTKYAIIPTNSMNSSLDVMRKLSDIIMLQPGVSNFIVTVRSENGKSFVELLEETGAA